MLKIRLMRIGAKKRPFYRVVVIDERSKRSGQYLELLGTYNPLTEPHEINLKQDRIDHWTKLGAQKSNGFLRIIGKAPQRPARKAKKEKKEEPVAPTPIEKPTEEAKSELAEANGAALSTPKVNESSTEVEAEPTISEQIGSASDASQPDEPTPEEEK